MTIRFPISIHAILKQIGTERIQKYVTAYARRYSLKWQKAKVPTIKKRVRKKKIEN